MPTVAEQDLKPPAAALEASKDPWDTNKRENLFVVLVLGVLFGVILVKSEVVSWFRIQEMFRFQSIHMYGVLGSAVLVAGVSVALIRRFRIANVYGQAVDIPPREWKKGYAPILGGIIFGMGWALLGACPGPLYALIGSGTTIMIVPLLSAIVGVWIYGYLRPKLPH